MSSNFYCYAPVYYNNQRLVRCVLLEYRKCKLYIFQCRKLKKNEYKKIEYCSLFWGQGACGVKSKFSCTVSERPNQNRSYLLTNSAFCGSCRNQIFFLFLQTIQWEIMLLLFMLSRPV